MTPINRKRHRPRNCAHDELAGNPFAPRWLYSDSRDLLLLALNTEETDELVQNRD